jgi:SNF2 family DNA or RNA helicase
VAHAKVALTGTPVENHLGELWSLVDLVCPGLLGEAFAFQRVFRAPIETGTDPSRLFALRARIAPLVLRRAKDQVLRELPPKTEVDVPVALGISQRALYEGVRLSMEARVRKTLEDHGIGGSSLVLFDALLKLRQCCCDPSLLRAAIPAAADVTESAKREAIVSDVVALVAEGRSIVLFSQFVGYLDLLAADLSASEIPFVRLQGDTKDRASPVAAFQRGDVPVILVSLRAGGTGLTLTAADTVIHADPWWNPAVEDQATDRAHRIGQERPLLVRRYLVRDSIEEKLVALQHRKRGLAALALEATTSDGPEAGGRGELSMFDVDELLALFAR